MTTDPKQETVEERAREVCDLAGDPKHSLSCFSCAKIREALRSYGAEREAAGKAAGRLEAFQEAFNLHQTTREDIFLVELRRLASEESQRDE